MIHGIHQAGIAVALVLDGDSLMDGDMAILIIILPIIQDIIMDTIMDTGMDTGQDITMDIITTMVTVDMVIMIMDITIIHMIGTHITMDQEVL